MIVAFLYIKKAYDSVPRNKIWEILNLLGVPYNVI